MKKTLLITGGTGLVGTRLTRFLDQERYDIKILTRKPNASSSQPNITFFTWNPDKGYIDENALQNVDAVIHLAGTNVGAKRWSKKRKESIMNSRTQTTQVLFDSLSKIDSKPKAFVSASASGYYGFSKNKVFKEEDPPGNDFLAEVTKNWEASVDQIKSLNLRTVKIRIGMVYSSAGGALPKFMSPIKKGFGAVLGSGKQLMPWIHIDDLCGIIEHSVNQGIEGAYNACANEPVSNKQLTRLCARILKKKIWLPPAPKFIVQLLFGKVAALAFESQAMSNNKIRSTGYEFKFTDPETAIRDLLSRNI